jgi:hypothetical protein
VFLLVVSRPGPGLQWHTSGMYAGRKLPLAIPRALFNLPHSRPPRLHFSSRELLERAGSESRSRPGEDWAVWLPGASDILACIRTWKPGSASRSIRSIPRRQPRVTKAAFCRGLEETKGELPKHNRCNTVYVSVALPTNLARVHSSISNLASTYIAKKEYTPLFYVNPFHTTPQLFQNDSRATILYYIK